MKVGKLNDQQSVNRLRKLFQKEDIKEGLRIIMI